MAGGRALLDGDAQDIGGLLRQPVHRLANSRQAGHQESPQCQTVEPDDGDIAAHRFAGVLRRAHRPDGHHIRDGIGRRDLRIFGKHPAHGLVAFFVAEARLAVFHQVFGRQPALGKGRPAAGKAHPGNIAEGGAPADDGDVAVPAVQQHLHRADRSRIVIGGHTGQVLKAQLLG